MGVLCIYHLGTAALTGGNPEMTTAEMTTDAKLVYNVDGGKLIALADKYGATSKSLSFARQNPSPVQTLAAQACGSKSATAELRRNTYAAINQALA